MDDASFATCWHRFLQGYDGINVTAPFKQDAFRAVDALSDSARRSGAVNLVVREENGLLKGYNTDVDGVLRSVRECGVPVSRALVVGAGRAAVVAAQLLGCTVSVANRTFEKAASLAQETGCQALPLPEMGAASADLVIYTLPTALEGLGAVFSNGSPWRSAVILEANYKTPCLAATPCRAYLSGRRWLLHQAITGYALFTGEAPDTEKMSKVL